MIAGEIEFLAIAGSTTASAAIGGAEVFSYGIDQRSFADQPRKWPVIQKPEDLRGKSIGISRRPFGT